MHSLRLGGAVRRCVPGAFAPLILLALVAGPAAAGSPSAYLVEEDWELALRDPDPAIHSPQITVLASPDAAQVDCYFQLQLNHAADDGFSGGGFQVAAMRDDQVLDFARSDFRTTLRNDFWPTRWTSVMALIDGQLMYAVKDGWGPDWGRFGGPEYLVRMPAGGLTDLAGYSPQQSRELVDIGFGANRVRWLELKAVRVYYTDGTVRELDLNADQ